MTEPEVFAFDDPNLPDASEAALETDFAKRVKKAIDTHKTWNLCQQLSLEDIKKAYHCAALWYVRELGERGFVIREAREAREKKFVLPPGSEHYPKTEIDINADIPRAEMIRYLEDLVKGFDSLRADTKSMKEELERRAEVREDQNRRTKIRAARQKALRSLL